MRKAQKQQAEDFIKLLDQTHDEIKKAIETKRSEEALGLLEQCQDGAIQLGILIERTEGEGIATVKLLEEYCEMIYRIHEEIMQNRLGNANKVSKNLRKVLIKIENSVKNDIKLRIEAVFLPYKASMWDSLESVWKAADEDPDCDAYVIPIPYYDKNPDGSFREMHYEGDLYPDYVPVTHYETFDFAKHLPDMIFIHNPYDDYNHVTSVHPFCYSRNLKQFTEQLIYIPYFILNEIKPDDEEKVKNMEHFCNVPAMIYADKVIVQSEDMRQIYINVMTKLTGKEPYGRKFWEGKILGLGSPKVDKVLNTRKEDLDIPEEWLKVIRKEDGSFKKIIFYNTSVSALLKHDEKMLRKMEDVFGIFMENSNEIALLWRPHPLIKATIESMRPQLWEEYKKIVQKYREEGWGIYDDTADMDRAVALSDVYYGDGSSIVQLCQKAGKPIMLQDVTSIGEKEGRLIVSDYIQYNENVLYFIPLNYNALMKYDMKLGNYELITYLEAKESTQNCLYTRIFFYNKKILAVPMHAKKFAIIDINTSKVTYIPIPNREKLSFQYGYFSGAVQVGGYVYAIGYTYPGIVRISMADNKVKVIDGWYSEYQKKSKNKLNIFFSLDCCMVDNALYLAAQQSNCIMKYCFDTNQAEFFILGNSDKGFRTICYDGQFFWLTEYDGTLIKWKKDTEWIQKIQLSIEIKEVPYIFSTSLYHNGKLYLFPGYYEYLIIVDTLNNNQVERISLNKSHEKMRGELVRYVMEIGKGRVLVCGWELKMMWLYNMENDELESLTFEIPDCIPDLGQYISNFGMQEIKEDNIRNYGLRQYIKLGYLEDIKGDIQRSNKMNGNNIYEYCKREIRL